jgi:hypothetical protein
VTARLPIKVVPGSSRDAIAGWLGSALKVRVTAPAERGRANAAALALLASALRVPPERLRLVAGHGSSRKVVEVSGLSEAELRERLPRAAD